MSIIYRYYKRYLYCSHKTAKGVGGRLDEPEVPLGGVAAGGMVVPKCLPVVWPEGRVSRRLPRTYVRGMADHHEGNEPCTR